MVNDRPPTFDFPPGQAAIASSAAGASTSARIVAQVSNRRRRRGRWVERL